MSNRQSYWYVPLQPRSLFAMLRRYIHTSALYKRLFSWVRIEFGVYINNRGAPYRSIIEWEGTATHVAWHPPYVLLFNPRFIEVRHTATGRLVQIIPGNDFRCTWDGCGTDPAPPAAPCMTGWDEWTSTQESRVHGVMNIPPDPSDGVQPTVQHVFELLPVALDPCDSWSISSQSAQSSQSSPSSSPPPYSATFPTTDVSNIRPTSALE